jgi:hypothetical protein
MPSERVRRPRRAVESVGARRGVRGKETTGEDVRRGVAGGTEAVALTVEVRGAGGHRTRPTGEGAQRVVSPKERANLPYLGLESFVGQLEGCSSLVIEAS